MLESTDWGFREIEPDAARSLWVPLPCAADTSATITTAPGQYNDVRPLPSLPETRKRLLRQTPPRILHHLEEVRPSILNGHPIHFNHLFPRHRRDFDAAISEVSKRHIRMVR